MEWCADTLVVVTGPTAVGKTDLCLQIARQYGIPVINADSRQIYRGLTIGTAAPTEEQQRGVRHYFVGSLPLDHYYNAAMYEHDVMELLARLFPQSPHRVALLSGGSMMYIDAVCNGIDDIPTITPETRAAVRQQLEERGLDSLCDDLRRLDPQHFETVDKRNTRRVVHALEICLQTGKPYSSFLLGKGKRRPFRIVKIALNRHREALYERINKRVDRMVENGLVEEARHLFKYSGLNALNTVGYKELFDYFRGRWPLTEAIERIKGNTRRYARKQLTWFKRDKSITWFDADNTQLILNHIAQQL